MVNRCDFYSDEEYEYAKQMEYEEFQESLAMEEEKERLAYEEYLKEQETLAKMGDSHGTE